MVTTNRTSRLLTLTALSLVCSGALTAHAYTIKPPWRGDSLPQGSFMRTSGHTGYDCVPGVTHHCSLDLSAVRWDDGAGTYTTSRTTSSNATTTADHVTWEMPLYSPVDGAVVACWWNMPEDNDDGSEPAGCDPQLGCMKGGNHLVIRTDDDKYVALMHMRQGSIPNPTSGGKVLCPIPAVESVVPVSGPEPCGLAGQIGVRQITRMDERGFIPVRVKKGEFLGRVGNSGGSETPHLHLNVGTMTTDPRGDLCMSPEVIDFAEAFTQPMKDQTEPEALDWTPLGGDILGETLVLDGSKHLLWGDPVGGRTDALELEIGTRPAVALGNVGGVAAFRNGDGNLATVGFQFDGDDAFDLGAAQEHVAVRDVAIARTWPSDDRFFAVAVRDGTDRLRVIPYALRADADLVKGTGVIEATAGVGRVEVTTAPTHRGVVVALKNSMNRISIINYGVSVSGSEQLTAARRGSAASAQEILDLDVATVTKGFKGVVTVERAHDDTMWLRTWKISVDGTDVVLTDSELARSANNNLPLSVTDVDIAVTGDVGGVQYAVVSAATAAGLRVQAWKISSIGQLTRSDQVDGGGPVSQLDSAQVGPNDVALGLQVAGEGRSLLSFHVDPSGALRRVGTRDASDVSALALDGYNHSNVVLLTADAATKELSLHNYRTNYSASL